MTLKESSRIRLERLTARLAARRADASLRSAHAEFEGAFRQCCQEVVVPLLRDLGVQLATAGHAFRIEPDGDHRGPSVIFHVDLAGGANGNANAIGLFVRHDAATNRSEVISYLALKIEFELARFRAISEMTPDRLEQMLVDGLEHLLACNE